MKYRFVSFRDRVFDRTDKKVKKSERELIWVIGWRRMSFDPLRIAVLIVRRRIIGWIWIIVFHRSLRSDLDGSSRTKLATNACVSAWKIEMSFLYSLSKFSLINLPSQILRPKLVYGLLPFCFIVFAGIVVHRLVSAIVPVRVRYPQDDWTCLNQVDHRHRQWDRENVGDHAFERRTKKRFDQSLYTLCRAETRETTHLWRLCMTWKQTGEVKLQQMPEYFIITSEQGEEDVDRAWERRRQSSLSSVWFIKALTSDQQRFIVV